MSISTATGEWNGTFKAGSGTMKPSHGSDVAFSTATRFEGAQGSNPEEMIGAALAGCFSMALTHALAQKGNAPQQLDVEAAVDFVAGKGITGIHLTVQGQVDGIDNDDFVKAAQDAKVGCPVSKALTGVDITLDAALA